MLTIDGSVGEGGGQILRTTLGLSLVSGEAVRIHGIRQKRARPGLMRQHLAAVRAAAEVGGAEVTGAEIGSREITFRPRGPVSAGSYRFDVGSAGSTTLVLQTVLPALIRASAPSEVVIAGGTHNPMAPPFDFLDRAFLPLLARMGPRVSATLEAPGFYPAGGGRLRAVITPAPIARLDLGERGAVLARSAVASVANLPISIARREIEAAREVLGWERAEARVARIEGGHGPGNVLTIAVACEHVTEVFTGFGEKGVSAEQVGTRAASEARAWLDAGVPVGEHLADQLLLPMAIGAGGSFRTLAPSRHTRTQIDLLQRVLGTKITVQEVGGAVFEIAVTPR